VFSAAFAREYDAEYIPHRPWIMLVPLGASLVSSFLLWCVLWLAARRANLTAAPFFGGYRVFLGLFWLTAPIAWLYAIPVERFMEPAEAVKANYALLAIVSAWRVFIMIRVAQVLTGRKPFAATALVLIYGYVVMSVALWLSPWNVLDLMGGVRRTEVEAAHMSIVTSTSCLSILAAPLVIVWALVHLGFGVASRKPRLPLPVELRRPQLDAPAHKDLWALAIASILALAALLPFTQPPLIDKPTDAELIEHYEERRREWWEDHSTRAFQNVALDGETLNVQLGSEVLKVSAETPSRRTVENSGQSYTFRLTYDNEDDFVVYHRSATASGLHLDYQEGTRDFASEQEAIDWLRTRLDGRMRYTSDGLAAGWKISPDGSTLLIEIWQIELDRSRPARLSGAEDPAFKRRRK